MYSQSTYVNIGHCLDVLKFIIYSKMLVIYIMKKKALNTYTSTKIFYYLF